MAANPQAYADRKRAAMERVAQMRAEREAVTKSSSNEALTPSRPARAPAPAAAATSLSEALQGGGGGNPFNPAAARRANPFAKAPPPAPEPEPEPEPAASLEPLRARVGALEEQVGALFDAAQRQDDFMARTERRLGELAKGVAAL